LIRSDIRRSKTSSAPDVKYIFILPDTNKSASALRDVSERLIAGFSAIIEASPADMRQGAHISDTGIFFSSSISIKEKYSGHREIPGLT